jgi:hypothetical protein
MNGLRLGKLPAREDKRTFEMRMFLPAKLPPIPDSFNVDASLPCPITIDILGNDELGDCVMAGRGHHTRRFESREQGCLTLLPDKSVLSAVRSEYLKEGHGQDNGLVVLDSLNCWRKGWTVNRRKYSIYVFGWIHPGDREEVAAAIYLLGGVQFGLELPLSAEAQFYAGEPWRIVAGPKGKKGSLGGHLVYNHRYELGACSEAGVTAITWGKEQLMTWDFLEYYCDEAFAVVDNRDKWLGSSTLDVEKLDGYLRAVAG